ncbi:5950_t:CDS:2, partial [Funneliformis caledonium]
MSTRNTKNNTNKKLTTYNNKKQKEVITQKEEDIQDNLNNLLNNDITTVQNKNTGVKRGCKKKQQEIVDSLPPLSLNNNSIDNQQSKSKRSYKRRQKVDLLLLQTIAELLKDDEQNSRLISILEPEANFQEYIPLNTTVQSRTMSTVDSRTNSPIDDFLSVYKLMSLVLDDLGISGFSLVFLLQNIRLESLVFRKCRILSLELIQSILKASIRLRFLYLSDLPKDVIKAIIIKACEVLEQVLIKFRSEDISEGLETLVNYCQNITHLSLSTYTGQVDIAS